MAVAEAESMAKKPLDRFTVGGVAERVRELLRNQCIENNKAIMDKKQLRGIDNFCYKVFDALKNWGM